jgi:hypothetical protein
MRLCLFARLQIQLLERPRSRSPRSDAPRPQFDHELDVHQAPTSLDAISGNRGVDSTDYPYMASKSTYGIAPAPSSIPEQSTDRMTTS